MWTAIGKLALRYLPQLILVVGLVGGVAWYRHHLITEAHAAGVVEGKQAGEKIAAAARKAQGIAEQNLGQCYGALNRVNEITRVAQEQADAKAAAARKAAEQAKREAANARAAYQSWMSKYNDAIHSADCSNAQEQLCEALQDY